MVSLLTIITITISIGSFGLCGCLITLVIFENCDMSRSKLWWFFVILSIVMIIFGDTLLMLS